MLCVHHHLVSVFDPSIVILNYFLVDNSNLLMECNIFILMIDVRIVHEYIEKPSANEKTGNKC